MRTSRGLEPWCLDLLQVLVCEVFEAAEPLGDPGAPVAYAEVVAGVVEDHAGPDDDVLLFGVFLGELLDVHPDEFGETDGGALRAYPSEVVGVVFEELVEEWEVVVDDLVAPR